MRCILHASFLLLLAAVPAFAGAEPPASNPSVVLEQAPPPDSVGEPSPQAPSGRSLRRRPGVMLTEALEGDRNVPWYGTSWGALAIVLGLLGVLFLFLRRWAPSVRVPDSGVLKVLGRAALTPKHSLAVVQFGRRFVLVGISPEHVQVVSEVVEEEEAAELAGCVGARWPATPGGFEHLLKGEGAEYAEIAEPATRDERLKPPMGVKDLLRRVKALQRS